MVTGPLSGGQEDSLAEQAEGGAAIRLGTVLVRKARTRSAVFFGAIAPPPGRLRKIVTLSAWTDTVSVSLSP